MNAVDEYIPVPKRLVDRDFLMPVEDVFSITFLFFIFRVVLFYSILSLLVELPIIIKRGVTNTGNQVEIIGMAKT